MNNIDLIVVDNKLPSHEISQSFIKLIQGTDSNPITVNFTDEQINKLTRVLESHADIRARIQDVLGEKTESIQDRFRQLRDVTYYLKILDSELQRPREKEKVDIGLAHDFHQIVLKVNKVVKTVEMSVTPPWQTMIEALDKQIQLADSQYSNHKAPPNLEKYQYPFALTSKGFAQIHGEAFITDSGLEGSLQGEMLRCLLAHLSTDSDLSSKGKKLVHSLTQTLAVFDKFDLDHPKSAEEVFKIKEEFFSYIQAEINKLKTGESFFLPTGWISFTGGHAMYLEIIKQENQQLTLRVFNSGAGIENHASILVHDSLKFYPFLEITNIEEAKISGKDFLGALLEIRCCSKSSSTTPSNYSQIDLYQILFSALGGTRSKPIGKIENFITPQVAGTCTWSSLLAILQTYLPKEELSRIQYEIHLLSLGDFFTNQRKNLVEDEQTRFLLQKSAEQFCRELLDNYHNRIITLEELIAGKEAMQVILTSLHQAKQQAEYEALDKNSVDFKGLEDLPIKKGDLPSIPTTVLTNNQTELTAEQNSLYQDFSWIQDPKLIDTEMERFRLHCQQLVSKNNKQVLETSLHDFFIHLPLVAQKEDFWEGLPKDKLLKCMHEITLISEMLFRNYNESQRQKIQLDLLKGMATVHRLGILSKELPILNNAHSLPFQGILKDTLGTENHGRPMWDANLYQAKERDDLKQIFKYLNQACPAKDSSPEMFIINKEEQFLVNFNKQTDFLEHDYSLPKEIDYIKSSLSKEETKAKLFKKYPKLQNEPYAYQVAYALTDLKGDILSQPFCDLKKMVFLSKAVNLKLRPYELANSEGELALPIVINDSQKTVQIITKKVAAWDNYKLASFKDIKDPFLNLLIVRSREKQTASGYLGALTEGDVYQLADSKHLLRQFSDKAADIPIKLSLDEVKALLSLMTGADYDENDRYLEMQISKTISYFSSHLVKLKDPDFQALLRLLLFEADYLETFLQAVPSFSHTLADFINHGYETFLEHGDLPTAAFFIELGRHLETVIKYKGVQGELPRFPHPQQAISRLLKIQSCTTDEKTVLYKHLVGSYLTHPKSPLEVEDAKEILNAIAYVKSHPNISFRTSSYLDKEVDEVLLRYQEDFRRLIQDPVEGQKILQTVVEQLEIQSEAQVWDVTSRFPLCVSSDGSLSFNLNDGCLYQRNGQLSVLPKNIVENPLFATVFPHKNYRVSEQGGYYEFKDDEGRLTKCVSRIKGLIIQKELEEGVLYQYIPKEKLPAELTDEHKTLLGSLTLLHGKTYWKSLDQASEQKILVLNQDRKIEYEIYFAKPESSSKIEVTADLIDEILDNEPTNEFEQAVREKILLLTPSDLLGFRARRSKTQLEAQDNSTPANREQREKQIAVLMQTSVTNQAPWIGLAKGVIQYYQQSTTALQIQSIEKIMPKGESLILIDSYQDQTPFDFIKPFAGAQDILVWKNHKGVAELLEIPKLGLQFKLIKEGSHWEAQCIQLPGFKIAANQKIKGLSPFKFGLVLENSKGDRRVLIPRLKIQADKKGALTTEFSLQRSEESQPESYLVFNLDSKKGIHSSHREQQLLLAYFYLSKKEYSQAQELLRKSFSHVIPYTKQEQEVLEWMLELHKDNKDADPKASAVYLMALAQLLKNPDYHIPEDVNLWNSLEKDYNTYVTLHSHTTTFKLTAEEEISLIRTLMGLSQHQDFTFTSRNMASARLGVLSEGSLQNYATMVIPTIKPLEKHPEGLTNFTETDFMSLLNQIQMQDRVDWDQILITRPEESLNNYFIAFYDLAKKKDERLALLLEFGPRDNKVNENLLTILKAVWDDPDKFPPFDQFKRILTQGDWDKFEKEVLELSKKTQDSAPFSKEKKLESIRLEIETDSQAEEVQQESQKIHIQAPKPHVKILTPKQLKACFVEVNATGIQLSKEEQEELKSAINLSNEEGVAKTKSQHLQNDIDYVCSMPTKKQALLVSKKAEALKTILMIQQAEGQKSLLGDLQSLLNKANTVSSEKEHLIKLERLGTVKLEIKLEDLIISLITSDPAKLLEKNPTLTDQAIETILNDLVTFYASATRLQKVDRCLAVLQELEQRKSEIEESELAQDQLYLNLSEKLLDELERSRMYQVEKHPEYLILEYYQNLLMYQGQVDDMNKMVNPLGNPHLILQKMMASGKTKVFLPILALKKADGDSLSVIVVPPFQLETSLKEMNMLSGQAFHQTTHTLHFDRQSQFSVAELKDLNKKLEEIRHNKEYVVMTSKSLLCLYLKYQEMWFDYLQAPDDSPQMEEALVEMAKVLHTFKTKGKATLDEADLILLCMQEVIFTLGKQIPLIDGHGDTVGDIYESLYKNPELRSLLRTPQDTRKEEDVFTPESYHQDIKPKLLQTYWDFATAKNSVVGKFFNRLTTNQQALVKDYLLNGSVEGFSFIQSQTDQIKDLLAIVKEELQTSLPLTLNKRFEERFGFSDSPDEHLAIPFIANKVPSPSSRFKKPNTILNYTIQSYLAQGVPIPILKNIIAKFQENAMKEWSTNPNLKIQETEAGRGFLELCGNDESYHLMHLNDQDIERLASQLRTDSNLMFQFLRRFVYPDVKLFPKEISANGLTLINMFFEPQGFTGTPWNNETYHKKLSTIPEVGADGKTLALLWKRSKDLIHQNFTTSRFPAALDELFALPNAKEKFSAIIDSGNLFNGVDNEIVARAILERLPDSKKGVVFYQNNKLVILERGALYPIPLEKSQLTEKERFTYYDQWHSTGSDVKQMPIAHAMITVGKNTTLRDLAQGVWRMRELQKGQVVEFILPPETTKMIQKQFESDPEFQLTDQQPIELKHILRFVEKNEIQELKDQIEMSTYQKLENVVSEKIDSVLITPSLNPAEIKKHNKNLIQFLTKDQKDNPFESTGQPISEQDTTIVMHQAIDQVLKKVEPLFKQGALNSIDLKQLRQDMVDQVPFNILPNTLTTRQQGGQESTVEIEQQGVQQQETNQLLQKEIQQESQTQSKRSHALPHWNWKNTIPSLYDPASFQVSSVDSLKALDAKNLPELATSYAPTSYNMMKPSSKGRPPILSLAEIFTKNSFLTSYADAFDFQVSYNFLPVISSFWDYKRKEHEQAQPFDRQQFDIKNFLVLRDNQTGEMRTILLAAADSGYFLHQLAAEKDEQGKQPVSIILGDVNLGILQASNDLAAQDILNSQEYQQTVVKAKFFNGELNYSKQECQILEAWIKEKGVKKMLDLFNHRVLEYKPEIKKQFINSPLGSVFNSLLA